MTTPPASDRRALLLAYAYVVVVALSLGHFLYGVPVQYSDSFGQMLKLSTSWQELIVGEFTQKAFMRPFDWGVMKLVYDLSGGNYYAWFRGTHIVLLFMVLALYVALVRPRSIQDAAVLPLGMAVLVGAHTFEGTIGEAFPVNHFTEIVIFCLMAALLVMRPYRWWNDLLAAVVFAAAALTLESGLLVWVILIGGVLVGGRGISQRGVIVLSVLLGAYFFTRFVLLDVGSPGLSERSSGFGFQILEPEELIRRFEANPWPFYAYNVMASALSVLFAEPQTGAFQLTRRVLEGDVALARLISPLASLGATVLVGLYVWNRRRVWMARQFTRDDQLVALFLMVLAANAVISYPYVKDVVMSPAGSFLAVAVYVAARSALASVPQRMSSRGTAAVVAAFGLIGALWSVRAADAYVGLRAAANAERNEWAYIESSIEDDGVSLNESEAALLRRLRKDALFVHPAPPTLDPPFGALVGE